MLLHSYRISAGLTQQELAERARLSVRGISDLERGARTRPRQSTLRLLAAALGLAAGDAETLAAAAAADGSGRSAASNLPSPTTAFIGRDQEQSRVRAMLAQHRLVTLTGPGGCGKTRLAIEVVRSLAGQGLYALGVWLVDLGPLRDPEAIAEVVAGALPVHPDPRSRPEAVVVDYLRGGGALLTLDNCEHLVSACAPFVQDLLRACPELTVLVTSRETLHADGEATFPVPPLAVPEGTDPDDILAAEAVSLFADRARLAQPAFALTPHNLAAVGELTRWLDGIPLAIEIAAAWSRLLTPGQILERLVERRDLSARSSTAPPRHRALRATVAWSVALLTPTQAILLGRLSVFAGSFGLGSVEAVCAGGEVAEGHVLELLSDLVDKSLVMCLHEGQGTRYRLLQSIRQHAAELLQESGEAAELDRRHVAHFLSLARTPFPGQAGGELARWLDRLEVEMDEVRRALEWTARNDDETGRCLALAVTPLVRRGYVAEVREWLARGLVTADDSNPLRGHVLMELGWLHWLQAEAGAAEDMWREAVRTFRALGDAGGECTALLYLGIAETAAGDIESARRDARRALASYVAAGDERGRVRAHVMLAEIEVAARAPAEARRLLAEAGPLLDQADMALLAGIAGGMLGVSAIQDGELEAAAAHLGTALDRSVHLHFPWWTAAVVQFVAALATASGQPEQAVRLFAAARSALEALDLAPCPMMAIFLDAPLAAARDRCLPSTVDALRAQGRRLGQEEALALARTVVRVVAER